MFRRCLVIFALAACKDPAPPPPAEPEPVPVAEPTPPPTPAVVDAGQPAAKVTEKPDGTTVDGITDDAAYDPEDMREPALQRLLMRDPDRAIRALEQAPAPSAFHVAVLAQLAVRRRVEGPPIQGKESPLPPQPASGTLATEPGPAFVGVNELPVRAGKATVATLPAGTAVTIDKVSGTNASISVQLATRVDFDATGATPKAVATKTVSGLVALDALVTKELDALGIASQAVNQPSNDEGRDASLVLWHRVYLINPSETNRAEFLAAAWAARRPSWVAMAALDPVWVTPKSIKLAWACRGTVAKAKWVSPSPKLPEHACITGVDVRTPCNREPPPAIAKRIETLTALGFAAPQPMLEVVVDASHSRQLYAVSLPIRSSAECEEENEEHKLDLFGAVSRRLALPLGTTSMTVSFPVQGWHGFEHSVIGAQSEAKARDWLRSRGKSKWTFDAKGEPSPSLGVGDIGFRLERDVNSHSIGRLPQLNCDLCGTGDFR